MLTGQERLHIEKAIEKRVASFEAAERELNAVALLQHFWNGADFYMHNDGQRITYDAIAGGVQQAFPTLQSMEGGFTGIEIQVFADDVAMVTARFQETMTTKDGVVIRQRGAATWLWRLRNGEWTIAYGHVDHYPDATA